MFKSKKVREAEKEAAKLALKREGEQKQRQLLQEISRTKIKMSTFEENMNQKLRAGVNRAIMAKNTGDKSALKNAYIDIRMAMRFKALAGGMNTAMTRMESNVNFAAVASDMADTLERTGELTKMNPTINVSKLDSLYQKAMQPLSNIVNQMERFNEMNNSDVNDGLNISDEDVERVIQQVINGGVVVAPQMDFVKPAVQPVVQNVATPKPAPVEQTAQPENTSKSVDDMIQELMDLSNGLS